MRLKNSRILIMIELIFILLIVSLFVFFGIYEVLKERREERIDEEIRREEEAWLAKMSAYCKKLREDD